MVTINPGQESQVLDLLSTFFTAVLGGGIALLGVYLTNRHNANVVLLQHQTEQSRETRTLLRDRGEELYVLTHKWLGGLTGHYMRRNFVMQGKTMNECLELGVRPPREAL